MKISKKRIIDLLENLGAGLRLPATERNELVAQVSPQIHDTLPTALAGFMGSIQEAKDFCKANEGNLINAIGEKLGLIPWQARMIDECSAFAQIKDLIKFLKAKYSLSY